MTIKIVHQRYYTATGFPSLYVTANTKKELHQKLKEQGYITDPKQYPRKYAYTTIEATIK